MNDKIDIIILTVNRSENIDKLLDLLSKQTLVPNKIIIMNTLNDENDESKIGGVAAKYGDVNIEEHIVYKKDFKHGKTRNIASRYSDAKYIIYMTDDAKPKDNDLINNLYVGIVENKINNVVMSYAKQVANEDATYIEKKTREYNYGIDNVIKSKETLTKYGIKNYFCSNVCCVYDKEIFDKMNGFDDDAMFNEDELYAYKIINAGYSVLYNAKVVVYHSHNFTFMQQYKRNKLIGESQKIHKDIFASLSSESEGKKLIKYVTINCLKDMRIIDLIKFYVECIYKYKGYLDGKKII